MGSDFEIAVDTSDSGERWRRIGRYSIFTPLAQGGMGRVFVAQRDGAAEICVLKQLLSDLRTHEVAVRRFEREARVCTQLMHPRVARIVGAGVEDDTFCIAFEYIAGLEVGEINEALVGRGERMPPALSIHIALAVLEGLDYAHRATDSEGRPLEIVHRDLSPRNIMVSFDGEVKIIDFGLVRAKIDSFETLKDSILGTLRYMSPEQARLGELPEEPVDHRSDLYSFSVVLHELLTGRPLIAATQPVDVLLSIAATPSPPVTSLAWGLPPALDAVIGRGLAKNRGERWQSAREYGEALRHAAGSLAQITAADVSRFMRQHFPDDDARTRDMVERGRARHRRRYEEGFDVAPTGSGETPQRFVNTGSLPQTQALSEEEATASFHEDTTSSRSFREVDPLLADTARGEEHATLIPPAETLKTGQAAPAVPQPSRSAPPAAVARDPALLRLSSAARAPAVDEVPTLRPPSEVPSPSASAPEHALVQPVLRPLSIPPSRSRHLRAERNVQWGMMLAVAVAAAMLASVATVMIIRSRPAVTTPAPAPLAPTRARLVLSSTPPGAEIWLNGAPLVDDGNAVAKTPFDRDMPIGQPLTIELRLRGYGTYAASLILDAKGQRVDAVLVPEPVPPSAP